MREHLIGVGRKAAIAIMVAACIMGGTKSNSLADEQKKDSSYIIISGAEGATFTADYVETPGSKDVYIKNLTNGMLRESVEEEIRTNIAAYKIVVDTYNAAQYRQAFENAKTYKTSLITKLEEDLANDPDDLELQTLYGQLIDENQAGEVNLSIHYEFGGNPTASGFTSEQLAQKLGVSLPSDTSERVKQYSIHSTASSEKALPKIPGFGFSYATAFCGDEDTELNVTYEAREYPVILICNLENQESASEEEKQEFLSLAPSTAQLSRMVTYGASDAIDVPEISGYTAMTDERAIHFTPDAVGIANGDISSLYAIVTYRKKEQSSNDREDSNGDGDSSDVLIIPEESVPLGAPEVEIPEDAVPLGAPEIEIPEESIPLGAPEIEIPEDEIPLSPPNLSETPSETIAEPSQPLIELEDEIIPLSDAPKTGDTANAAGYGMLAGAAAAAGIWMTSKKKKKV